ncbi:L,D-transpeptidase family protein [Ferruginibacter sp. SUN106]|uniref:L,D-transpeptidase family protein n=1 Tax=Ferruginibacter sp. SUN106 TaxID=2978348 RepID=UPI003D35BD7F
MHYTRNPYLQVTIIIVCLFIISCNSSDAPKDKEIVADPKQMDKKASENIRAVLEFALGNDGKVDDSIRLHLATITSDFYAAEEYQPVWSSKENWQPLADTLFQFITNAEQNGLFPKDYHLKNLKALKNKLDTDSLKRMDAALWTRADLMFTDAFMRIIKDLKHGRLNPDSITINKDSLKVNEFFINNLNTLLDKKQFTGLLNSLQPTNKGYWELKNGIKRFLDSMDRRTYTYVTYPYKKGDAKDSLFFIKTLQKRLNESGAISFTNKLPDSTELNNAIQKYQKQKGIKADGKISSAIIKMMNTSDAERFKRIAITLDRYKQLPEKMPEKYIWVNLPGYYLWVIDHDTIALESKVICGKPDTRTPLLNSEITDMVTYPTWTVPTSIIAKQYLPKLKSNPGYLAKLGLRLVNNKGETIDAGSVNWSKYSKGIPYKVMQNSGDNNALGIFKFNFNNPYAVYLHDTNQRYLFKNASRALSHGCVRVQEWEQLAFYIARNDSMSITNPETLNYNTDSIKNWIAGKERHRIDVKNRIPIYIRYFSCEGKEGKIKFYDDIYGEDKVLREKYFADK